jgi:arsenical pump membrane protein
MVPGSTLLALAVLALTLSLIFWRPRGLPETGGACIGAALALLLRVASLADLIDGLRDTAGILAFLVAVMLLAGLAELAGVFTWAARITLVTARGRGWLLLVNVFVLGAVITLFLSLDVTAVVLTPLVCALVLPLRIDARPFVFACAFVANTASLALPVSNLTNMLVYDLLRIGFWDFVRYLALPNLVALALTLTLLVTLYWHRLPTEVRVERDHLFHLPSTAFFRWSLTALALTVGALFIAGLQGWPFWPFAFAGAAALAVVALAKRWVTPAQAQHTVAWGLPPFVVAMYVVVAGVYRALAPALVTLPETLANLPGPLPILGAIGITAVGANAVNNLPLALTAIQLLRSVPPDTALSGGASLRDSLAFGTLIGVNVGPNLAVTGSLATMLCLASARRQGIRISAWDFTRAGLVVTPPVLLATALTLWLIVR